MHYLLSSPSVSFFQLVYFEYFPILFFWFLSYRLDAIAAKKEIAIRLRYRERFLMILLMIMVHDELYPFLHSLLPFFDLNTGPPLVCFKSPLRLTCVLFLLLFYLWAEDCFFLRDILI